MIDENKDHPIQEPLLATMNLQRQISELTTLVERSNVETAGALSQIQSEAACHRSKAATFYEEFSTKYAPVLDGMIKRDKDWADTKTKTITYGTRGALWIFCCAFTAAMAGICMALSAEVSAVARSIFHR